MRYLILGGAQLAVGAAAIFARYALAASGPLAVAASRLCIAAAILLALAALRPAERLDRASLLRLSVAGVALAVHFATWIASLQYTSVAISTLLVATSPLWNAAYDAATAKALPSIKMGAAFAAGFLGLALVVTQTHTPAPIAGQTLLGAVLALAGSAAFAVYLIAVRPVRVASGTRSIVTVTYSIAAVTLAGAATLAHQSPPPLAAHLAWGGIIAMAVFSQLLGHTAMNAALRWFSPTTVSFSTLVEPVIAAVAALVLFGERIAPIAVSGGALILTAVGIVIWIAPHGELDQSRDGGI